MRPRLLMFCLAEYLWPAGPLHKDLHRFAKETCATHRIKAVKRESEVLDCDVPWEPEPGPR